MLRGSDAFQDLVACEVERIAGSTGDDYVTKRGHRCQRSGPKEIDSGSMGGDGISGEDSGNFPMLSERHVEDEVVACHAGDLEQLRVQWILVDRAFGCHGLAHEAWGVDDLYGLLRGEPRRNQFASAGKAKHEVLLDETESDVEIGFDEAFIDIYRRAANGRAERLMIAERAGVVVDYTIAGCDVRAEN